MCCCSRTASKRTRQWTGSRADAGTLDEQQESCREMGGSVGEGPCPEENVIGSCMAGGSDISRIVYYSPRRAAEARHACAALGGAWR